MKNLRDEINEITKRLQLSNEAFQLVRLTRYKQILVSIIKKFTTLSEIKMNNWWWDNFLNPRYFLYPEDALELLPELIDQEEIVWFVAEDDIKENDKFWLYEGKINAIILILRELNFLEYYIVSKKLDWIICENHHGGLIGSGKFIFEKMKALDTKLQLKK